MSQSRCQHALVLPGRLRPTVIDSSYQLAMNGDEHLLRTQYDVGTWATRVAARARALAAAEAGRS